MLSLEHFASVRAAIEEHGDRDSGLESAKIAPAEWARLQRYWLDELAAEVARGEDDLAARYLRAYEGQAAESPVQEPPSPRDQPPRALFVVPSPDAPPPLIASFTPPPEPPALPSPAPPRAPSTMAFVAPSGPATPFVEGAQAAPPSPRGEPAPRVGTGTAHLSEEVRGVSLPFPSQVSTAAASAPRNVAPRGSGTALAPEATSGPATPFAKPELEPEGFSLFRYAALVAARQEKGEGRASVLARFAIDEATHDRVEAHWQKRFAESGFLALDFERYLAEAKKALAEKKQKPLGSGTAIALSPPPAPPPALPSQGAPAAPREMTLDQYAFVAAAIRKALPADVPSVLERFRLTAASRKDLEAHWSARMSADPALRQAFIAALAKHLGAAG